MMRIAIPILACCLALEAGAAPLRDPFVRPAAARVAGPAPAPAAEEAPQPAPTLRALVLNAQRSLANIDGHVVAVGEQFSGYTVRRIDARGVLVVRNGREQLLTMQDKEPL